MECGQRGAVYRGVFEAGRYGGSHHDSGGGGAHAELRAKARCGALRHMDCHARKPQQASNERRRLDSARRASIRFSAPWPAVEWSLVALNPGVDGHWTLVAV